MMGIGHGAELSIVRAKTICAYRPLLSNARLEEPLAATWSTVQQVPEPPFLPGLDENEALAPSLARSLHFINDGKMLIAAYLDHGIVSVIIAEFFPHHVYRTSQLLESEFARGRVASSSTYMLHVSISPLSMPDAHRQPAAGDRRYLWTKKHLWCLTFTMGWTGIIFQTMSSPVPCRSGSFGTSQSPSFLSITGMRSLLGVHLERYEYLTPAPLRRYKRLIMMVGHSIRPPSA